MSAREELLELVEKMTQAEAEAALIRLGHWLPSLWDAVDVETAERECVAA